jgi:hypothetical protein
MSLFSSLRADGRRKLKAAAYKEILGESHPEVNRLQE